MQATEQINPDGDFALRQERLFQILQGINSGLGAVCVVNVEALAGLAAQVAAADHLTDERACTILAVTCLIVTNVHGCKADLKSDEISKL